MFRLRFAALNMTSAFWVLDERRLCGIFETPARSFWLAVAEAADA